MPGEAPLIDSFGRVHRNLRISVTDRCNIRCFYCMPAESVQFMERSQLLSFEEIERLVRAVLPLGIRKIRLTGGEPLVRRELHQLIARLVAIDGLNDIGLTTNGILLASQAQQLFDAGLRKLNVSLDALDAETFTTITRRSGFEEVIRGIQTAQSVGFQSIKVNAVAMRGLSETQIVPFGHFARSTGCEVRFIEFMPLDNDAAWQRDKVLSASEILARLADEFGPLQPVADQDLSAPASEYQFADGLGRIGIIASVTRPFCQQCNRVRVTADGKFRNCLFSLEEVDLRAILRGGGTDEQIRTAIRQSVADKWEGHEINTARFIQPERTMHSIGG